MRKSAFNGEGLRLIIGAVKIYVASVEALRKKETGDETQFTTKLVEVLMAYYAETGCSRPLIT